MLETCNRFSDEYATSRDVSLPIQTRAKIREHKLFIYCFLFFGARYTSRKTFCFSNNGVQPEEESHGLVVQITKCYAIMNGCLTNMGSGGGGEGVLIFVACH